MIVIGLLSCPDRLSPLLVEHALARGRAVLRLDLPDGVALAPAVAALSAAVAEAPAPVLLVGVGLAGSLLLTAASALAGSGARLLALFPLLGWHSSLYGDVAQPSAWPQRWLALAGRRPWRSWLSGVAISPTPGGLDGVYAGGLPSWADAATVLADTDLPSILVPVACPALVVLNRASPRLDLDRAQVLMPALNAGIRVATADPDDPALPDLVQDWAAGLLQPPEDAHGQ